LYLEVFTSKEDQSIDFDVGSLSESLKPTNCLNSLESFEVICYTPKSQGESQQQSAGQIDLFSFLE